ncbi:hypothetical protein [Luteolibacter soli]|uniref:Uncharacterized protein n=1 Tax=Luteolibacter soli TaxID=3135280 RepID=A0ABU9AUT7_9BACT
MIPSPDPASSWPSDGEATPPLSEHTAEVQREPADEALHRARQPRPFPDPLRGVAVEDLQSAVEGWIIRHPYVAVAVFFGAGCLAGLCSARSIRD